VIDIALARDQHKFASTTETCAVLTFGWACYKI
jgi:hypothetical protein